MLPATLSHATLTDETDRHEGASGNVTEPVVTVLSVYNPSGLAVHESGHVKGAVHRDGLATQACQGDVHVARNGQTGRGHGPAADDGAAARRQRLTAAAGGACRSRRSPWSRRSPAFRQFLRPGWPSHSRYRLQPR